MSQTLDEFRLEFVEEIRGDAQAAEMGPRQYFFELLMDKLVEMGEIPEWNDIQDCEDLSFGNKKMTVHAYCIDEVGDSLSLFLNDYKDLLSEVKIDSSRFETLVNRMKNYLQEATDGKIKNYFDPSNPIIKISDEIRNKLKINDENSLGKIKFFILTNKTLAITKDFSKHSILFNGIKIDFSVWDIERIHNLILSGKAKEPIIVNVKDFSSTNIPCIKAEMSPNLNYDAYLAILPGIFLHNIFKKYGAKLLEENVRLFLGEGKGTNKGIKETIRGEPHKFFTYNNGIACTAKSVEIKNGAIEKIEDLQIINGGQTTTSIYRGLSKHKHKLDEVYVPLKLTVINDENDEYDEVVGKIAKYANSQNAVSSTDLISNRPFHVKFAELSGKIQVPPREGTFSGSYWTYERTKGLYEHKKSLGNDKRFKNKYPKNQLLKKEELAKYYVTANNLQPDIASKGGVKCMQIFEPEIEERFSNKKWWFDNEYFYKRMIAYAILYRTTDAIVKKADWYQQGGYKGFIVPYTVSKFLSLLPKGKCLDYATIWQTQTIPEEAKEMINRIGFVTLRFILKEAGDRNVGEFCKKEDAWRRFRNLNGYQEKYMTKSYYNFELSDQLLKLLKNEEDWFYLEQPEKPPVKPVAFDININKVKMLSPSHWMQIRNDCKRFNIKVSDEVNDIFSRVIAKEEFTSEEAKIILSLEKEVDRIKALYHGNE